MEADSLRIAKVFMNGGDIHFRLPYFQREYAWKQDNWETLWNDISDLYGVFNPDENYDLQPEHFMGSLVVINEGAVHGTIPVFKLVDGQQRLITISLILCALADLIKNSNPPRHNQIRKYITNPDEGGDLYFKILPTSKHGDKQAYTSILRGDPDLIDNGSQIVTAYRYFRSKIDQQLQANEMIPDQLFLVMLNSLQVVFINLNHSERPYQIFESLNAKGKPLTQADLVRNYIAMKLPESRQPEIFENHWLKIEELLQENRFVGRSRLGELTAFLRHYLAFHNEVLGNEEHVYARFRDRIEAKFNTVELFEQEIKTLQRFAGYYHKFIRPEHEQNTDVRNSLLRLNLLEISTGYPFLLGLYEARHSNEIDQNQLEEAFNLLENYIVRRYLAGEPTNYLNRVFPVFWKDVDRNDFIPTLKEVLLDHNYPGDYRIRQVLYSRKLYDNSSITRAKTTLVLEAINRHLSRQQNTDVITILDGTSTIEHIMPQTLNDQWQADLGGNFEQVYDQYLHTLGNLTLVTTNWNAGLSNSAFSVKKGELARHGLILNHSYFSRDIPAWNADAIRDRADNLAELILEIWPAVGVLPQPRGAVYIAPVKLLFLDQKFEVASWRDVAQHTIESIIQLVDNFEIIAHSMPSFLSLTPFPKGNRVLSNGWNMNVNASAQRLKKHSMDIVRKAGLSTDEWLVETL